MVITGRSVLFTFLLGAGLAVGLGLGIGFGLRPLVPLLRDVDWLATVIAAAVYAAFVAAHLWMYGLRGLRVQLRLTAPAPVDLLRAFVAWAVVWVAAGSIWVTFRGWPPVDAVAAAVVKIGSMFGRLDRAGPALFAVALFQTVVLAPLAEELFYRGAMFGWLRDRRTVGAAIVVTSTLFTLQHPMPALWPLAFAFGVVAGWLRERTGSITPFLAMHALNSLTLVAIWAAAVRYG